MTDIHSTERIGNICTSKPVLFFALTNEEICCKILAALRKEIANPIPECLEFGSEQDVSKYFREKGIRADRAVGIHIDPCINQCFSPMCRGEKDSRYMPKWSPAFWGVRVKTHLPEERIRSAALQIHADFWRNLSTQRAKDKLPWGNKPTTPRKSGKYRRENRERRRLDGSIGHRYAVLGW